VKDYTWSIRDVPSGAFTPSVTLSVRPSALTPSSTPQLYQADAGSFAGVNSPTDAVAAAAAADAAEDADD